VAENFLDYFRVLPIGEHQRSKGVPEIVEPYHRQSRSLQQRLERAVEKVAGVKRSADLRGKNQPLLLPQVTRTGSLLVLLRLVVLESFYRAWRQPHATAPLR